MKRIWQKTKKATAFLLAVMLIAAMCPMSLAAENKVVYEYAPGETSNETTFTSVATNSSSALTNSYKSDAGCISITEIRYDRLSNSVDSTGGHPQYNAFRLTGLAAGEYKISFKNAAQSENTQKVSAAPAVYFFKAQDNEYKSLKEAYKGTRASFLNEKQGVNLANDILGYFNFAEAERGAYTAFKNDAGEDVVVKVTEPGDYYIAFSYVPKTLELAKYFRYANTTETATMAAKTDIQNGTVENHSETKNWWLELHIGGIKLEKLASEAASTTLSYIVRADERANDSKITVYDDNYTVNGTNVGSWTVDRSFTATATGDDFAYWANGNGTPVSTEATYTFTPKSNFVLEAVYAPADTATKKVQFWNYNRVYLDEVTADAETLDEKMPEDPTLNGWDFTGWKTDANTVFTADTTLTDVITRVVAQFTKNATAFSVGGETKAYDDTFTKTAADTEGENAFSYWTIDGQVASYEKTLSFNVWDSVEVAAVYEGTKEAIPTIVLDKVNADEYFIHYEVPTGYTPVDAGIVFGTSESTPRVDSCNSKASVKSAGAKGQFTAAPGDDTHTVARGYVMYKDSADNYRIIYSAVK